MLVARIMVSHQLLPLWFSTTEGYSVGVLGFLLDHWVVGKPGPRLLGLLASLEELLAELGALGLILSQGRGALMLVLVQLLGGVIELIQGAGFAGLAFSQIFLRLHIFRVRLRQLY